MTTKKGGRPIKFKSVEILQDMIDAYFNYCDENKKPYTITGLAIFLNTTRETLLDYQNSEKFKLYSDTIKKAKQKCQNYAEEYLYSGKNIAGAIFNLKANYGWNETHKFELSGADGNPIETRHTIEYVRPKK